MRTFRHTSIPVLLVTLTVIAMAITPSVYAQRHSSHASSTLIIRRIPTLGNDVALQLNIDGHFAGSVLYSQKFEHSIPPGRHTIKLRATPRVVFNEPSITMVDIRPGETCAFTAYDDGTKVSLRRNY